MTALSVLGVMGVSSSGKSTVGKRLARSLNLKFIDLDEVIEDEAGSSIPMIFELQGEAAFRERETAALARMTQLQGVVLATGAIDVAIHRPHREGDTRNHHAHLLATTRVVTDAGLGSKTSIEWKDADRAKRGLEPGRIEVTAIRSRWSAIVNEHLAEHGSIPEIFDGDEPRLPRGCIAQAWSIAQVLECWIQTQPTDQEGH